ncbi:MAG: acyltransferase [Massilia sp.]
MSGPRGSRHSGLDLLRAIAIVWVMLYHLQSYGVALPSVVGFGWMGVDLFFVLSGYLIGWQLLKPYTHGAQPSWGQFFARRAFRVLPAYLAVVAIYFAVPAVRESEGIAPLWQFLTFTQNLFPDYFRNRALSHIWSLCIEEHFYLLLPPVVWMLARRPRAGRVAAVAIAIFAGGMLLRAWLWQHQVAPFAQIRSGEGSFILRFVEKIYNPTWTRLDGLLAGVMLATAKGFRPRWWSHLMARGPWLLAAGLAGVMACTRMETPGLASSVVGYPLLSASLAAIVAAVLSPTSWTGRLRLPGAGPVAAMAFSLYLTNKSVFHVIHEQLDDQLDGSRPLALAVYLGAALAVGAILYLGVERPGMRLRARLLDGTRKPVASALVGYRV